MTLIKQPLPEDQKIEVQTSEQFSVNWRDIRQTFIMTAIGAIVGPLIQSLQEWDIVTSWRTILITGVTAGLAQLARKFFTPSVTMLKIQPPIDEPAK